MTPPPPDARASADRRIGALLFAASFLFFALWNPGHFTGSDEIAVYEMTRSIVERGDLAIPALKHTHVGADGRRYSYFSPGQSALVVPLFQLGRLADATLPFTWRRAIQGETDRKGVYVFSGEVEIAFVMLYGPLVCAALVVAFFRFQRVLGASLRTALVCAALLAGATHLWTLSTYFLRHAAIAFLLITTLSSFYRWKAGAPQRVLWLGTVAASAILVIRVPAATTALTLAPYLAWALWLRSDRGRDRTVWLAALPAIATPLAVAIFLHSWVNLLKWGGWFESMMIGQHYRFVNPISEGVFGFLLSPGSSIFVYSPILLLAPLALARFWHSHRSECVMVLWFGLTQLLFYSRFDGWNGLWSAPGPRYLFLVVPVMLLALGPWLDGLAAARRRHAWIAVGVLATLGAWVQLASVLTSWGDVMLKAGYFDYEPEWGFLYAVRDAPAFAATRLLLWGDVDKGPWLWNLALGWKGFLPRPGVAALLLACWTAAFGACAWGLRRELRRGAEAP